MKDKLDIRLFIYTIVHLESECDISLGESLSSNGAVSVSSINNE